MNPGVRYELGRALTYAGRIDEAIPELERAAAKGYPQAQFVLGYLYLDGRYRAPKDACRALDLILDAARTRYPSFYPNILTQDLLRQLQASDKPTS